MTSACIPSADGAPSGPFPAVRHHPAQYTTLLLSPDAEWQKFMFLVIRCTRLPWKLKEGTHTHLETRFNDDSEVISRTILAVHRWVAGVAAVGQCAGKSPDPRTRLREESSSTQISARVTLDISSILNHSGIPRGMAAACHLHSRATPMTTRICSEQVSFLDSGSCSSS
ncbi:hypothetical protein BDZ94DRAFT_413478 [Collybia nuda]|uniref:Uncharacterized protein n=1 Tax=Collybia nuda TaxID=64659 RepID=A0A9P6CKB4_9AGAR|nr:hypothetical protein BDZ94DRAFT_413478 [Collybia nuda]